MDGETVITWSLQNWITVVVMVLVFFFVLVLISKGAKAALSKTAASQQAS